MKTSHRNEDGESQGRLQNSRARGLGEKRKAVLSTGQKTPQGLETDGKNGEKLILYT